ncbi:Peptidase_S15 domain-containing protein [Durusdinium trenchii]|uniref:Peptidase_S15 domain-containing protein n=1 Tax=Durusdinium trenchii TaxID=1381693 RepID=A0ABP0QGW0_9DINO
MTSTGEKFPILIMANSWSVPQIEYVVQAQELARAGYIILEYETRGWYRSGGEIDCAGEKDQRDISEVISYTLNRSDWQPDPERLAMVGISYGAGLALLGAVRDVRIKAVVAMSGWTDFQEVYRQMLAGNISGFAEFAQIRSVNLSALEARKLPIFMSNNFEDRVFSPDDALAFLEHYKGPKRLLLNQGIHASAEIPGLFGLKNHVWAEAKKWLHTYLKGEAYPAPPLLEMQLRSNWATREQFDLWPSARIEYSTLVPSPRGTDLYGELATKASPSEQVFDTITFSKATGISAGLPYVGEAMQVFVDHRIRSKLLSSSRQHAIWYYKEVSDTRLCGTPRLTLDLTASHSKWQIVAYLFGVNRRTKVGTLISHGSVTCWNCTAGVRGTHHITLRSLCEDLGGWGMGGVGLALNMFSELYQPANAEESLAINLHYSSSFSLVVPITEKDAPNLSTIV